MKMYVTAVLVYCFYLIPHSITKISDELRLRARAHTHTHTIRTHTFLHDIVKSTNTAM